MPSRLRLELADVAAAPNLAAALWAAARGKRARPDVAAFLAHADAGLAQVQVAILAGRLPDGGLREFAIRDPKPRLIHAAPFVDRVAHHALMRLMEPRLEQALVPTSFACRPGRGVHAALRHAQGQMLRHRSGWTVKLDVWHCFPQLPHDRVLALLARRFKGSALHLAEHIVRGHASAPGSGCGLPIGSLTSQHFANQYLGEIDRYALAQPECLGHVRYMDDVVLWCAGRAQAQALCGMRLGLQGVRPGLRPGAVAKKGPGACCVAARGSTTRGTAGRRTATRTIPASATTTSAFGLPKRIVMLPRSLRKPSCGPGLAGWRKLQASKACRPRCGSRVGRLPPGMRPPEPPPGPFFAASWG